MPAILAAAVPAWGQGDDQRIELGSEDAAPSANAPVRSAVSTTATSSVAIDYDTDDDGLIEIATLTQLNAVRWDLNGNGWPDSSRNASAYASAFPNAAAEMGCTLSCSGYELGASATSSVALTIEKGSDDFAGDGKGWKPIGSGSTRFGATFKGNGHAIRQLAIRRSTLDDVGLFGAIGKTAIIDGVRLVDVSVSGNVDVGGLVGDSLGSVVDSHVAGIVRGDAHTGGLVGRNGGSILTSSAVGQVSGRTTIGGLVGTAMAQSTVAASYAVCDVTSVEIGGGLVGALSGSLTATYASSHINASSSAGGLVGYASGSTISASYANGRITAGLLVAGGLVGRADGGAGAPTIADSYWDVDTAGYDASAGGTGQRSEQLRALTSATGTYANWDDLTVDGQGAANDDPWDFGTASQYPVLNFGALTKAAQRSAIATTTPASFNEENLTGAKVVVTLPTGYNFVPALSASDFELIGAPASVTISSALRKSAKLAQLTLAAGDFDEAWALGVRTLRTATGGSIGVATATVSVGATVEVPAALADLSVTAAWGRVDASWSAASEANFYRVQWKHGSQAYSDDRSAVVTGTSHTLRDLPALAHTVKVTPHATLAVAGTGAEASATPRGIYIASTVPSPLTEDALVRTATVTLVARGFRFQYLDFFHVDPAGVEFSQKRPYGNGTYNDMEVSLPENVDFDADTALRFRYGIFSVAATQWIPLLATDESAPAQVTGLAAAPGERLLDLSWNAATDATRYKVQWRDGAQEWGSTAAGAGEVLVAATSTRIAGLAADTTYTMRVVSMRVRAPDGPPSAEITAVPLAGGDFDSDDDGLIEIATLAQLNAVRWDLNGDGTADSSANATAYAAAFRYRRSDMGCPSGCRGYELGTSATSSVVLDFTATSTYANGGAGWLPIATGGAYGAAFEGNGHAIRNLSIARTTTDDVGLFAVLGGSARVQGVRLLDVDVRGANNVGALAGENRGAILASFSTGSVSASSTVGGLVGYVRQGAVIAASYSASDVSGTERVGGLAGAQQGSLTATYASGKVRGTTAVGGLTGEAAGTVSASYARGAVSGANSVGGLIGRASSTLAVANSYWDRQTTGQSASAGGGLAKNPRQLREHQGATDIFSAWDGLTVDPTGAGDDHPWHFGTQEQYPVLNFGSLIPTVQRAILAVAVPVPLAERTLDGATVRVALPLGRTYRATIDSDDFALAAPSGVVLAGSPVRASATVAELTLALVGDFSEDSALGVTALATGHTGSADLTTAPVPVSATVEGLDLQAADLLAYGLDEGKSRAYTVALRSAPTGNVAVAISSNNAQVVLRPARLTFSSSTWNTAQTVVVRYAHDSDGSDESVVLTHDPSGGHYSRTADAVLSFTVNDDDRPHLEFDTAPAVAGDQLTTMQLVEDDTTSRAKPYTVRLAMRPSTDVTVAIASDDPGAVVAAPAELTFPRSLWDVAQTVTATAQSDVDGADERGVKIRHRASGGDYNGVSRDLSVDVVDTDQPVDRTDQPALVFDTAGLALPAGASADYTVALATRPSAPVTVSITATGPVRVLRSSLTFGVDNWHEAQTVGIRTDVFDDAPAKQATLSHSAAGGDYQGLAADLSVHVLRATPGLSVTATELAIDEGGRASYQLRLDTQPQGQVRVNVGVRGAGVRVVPEHVVFNTENWNQPAAIAVRALVDADGEDGTATLTHALTGYGDVTAGVSVEVTVRDPPDAALLSALSLQPGALTPEFDPATRSYEVDVASATSVTVLATASWPQAEVAITPRDASASAGHQIALAAGNNEVVVQVQNGGRTTDYTVRVVRTGHSTSRPPEVAAQLPAVALEVGASETIDLAPGFRDPDGDPLAYTASSAKPGVATVEVSGSRARIAGRADGSVLIVVSATDPTGLTASQSIPVTVGNVVEFEETAVAVVEGEVAMLTVVMRRAVSETTVLGMAMRVDEDPDTHDATHHDYHERELSVAIPAGRTSAIVGVGIHDDEHIEPVRETFVVGLHAPSGVAVGHAHQASVTIHEGICDRLARIQEEVTSAVGHGCATISADDLASQTALDLSACRGCALRPGDLDGFVNLRELSLAGSGMRTLPSGGFAALPRLRALDLSANRLTALPPRLFAGLRSLEEVDLSDNPGAPFKLTVELHSGEAESSSPEPTALRVAATSASAPTTLTLHVAEGAPFPMAVWLAAKNAWLMTERGTPMAGAMLGRGQTGVSFAVRPAVESMAWAWPVAAPAMPRSLCDGLPCYRGLETAMAKQPMMLFEDGEHDFVPPDIPMPMEDQWALPLDDVFADAAAGPMEYEATSSDPAVATVALRQDALVVDRSPGGEGPVTITVEASAAGTMISTLRFTTTVELGHRPFLRGWRLVLHEIAPPPDAVESSTRQAVLRN